MVDESDSVRDLLSDFSCSGGYEVAAARNGDEALKMLKEKHFSILVTGLSMPMMNGIELINYLDERRRQWSKGFKGRIGLFPFEAF